MNGSEMQQGVNGSNNRGQQQQGQWLPQGPGMQGINENDDDGSTGSSYSSQGGGQYYEEGESGSEWDGGYGYDDDESFGYGSHLEDGLIGSRVNDGARVLQPPLGVDALIDGLDAYLERGGGEGEEDWGHYLDEDELLEGGMGHYLDEEMLGDMGSFGGEMDDMLDDDSFFDGMFDPPPPDMPSLDIGFYPPPPPMGET